MTNPYQSPRSESEPGQEPKQAPVDRSQSPVRGWWRAPPRPGLEAQNGDALDWTATILFVLGYAGTNLALLRKGPGIPLEVLGAFGLPLPAGIFALLLVLQLTSGRPSWACVFVITLGLLAVAYLNYALYMSIT